MGPTQPPELGKPTAEVIHWIIVVAAAAVVAALALWAGALRPSGAVAATGVGASVLGFGGIGPALVLVFFFVSSSALSAAPGGGPRSARAARQVLANGGIAALAALFYSSHPLAALAFLGALAAATADTWATEVGVRLGRTPRSILSFQPRAPGASGAISTPGTLAAAAGTLAVAGAGAWLVTSGGDVALAVAAAGFVGSVVDSVLGDGLQAVYSCPACGASPEVARHEGCRVRAVRVSGVPGLDNDVVNWLTTFSGAALAVVLRGLVFGPP